MTKTMYLKIKHHTLNIATSMSIHYTCPQRGIGRLTDDEYWLSFDM